jgi:hypothetical protein
MIEKVFNQIKNKDRSSLLFVLMVMFASLMASCTTFDSQAAMASSVTDYYVGESEGTSRMESSGIFFNFPEATFRDTTKKPFITIDGEKIPISFEDSKEQQSYGMGYGSPITKDGDRIYRIDLLPGEHQIDMTLYPLKIESSISGNIKSTTNSMREVSNSFMYNFKANKVYAFQIYLRGGNTFSNIGFFNIFHPSNGKNFGEPVDSENAKQIRDDLLRINGKSFISNEKYFGLWVHELSPNGTIKTEKVLDYK